MRGEQRHTIDSKNRLFVPSKYREELGTKVVVALSVTAKCIWVYSKENWDRFEEKISSLPQISAYEAVSWLYANSDDLEIDTQGRLAIPAKYLRYAGITKNIVSTGARDHMEIWDETAFDEKMENTDVSALRKVLMEHGL